MGYHLFICSSPASVKSAEALAFAKTLIDKRKTLAQIFFYADAVEHIDTKPTLNYWLELCPPSLNLQFCSAYIEEQGLSIPAHKKLIKVGLVDFFARHWQDQGVLVQF